MKLYLSPTECNVLFKKYVSEGLMPFEASIKINKLKNHLHNMVLNLKEKGKTDIEIEKKFKLEWEKICQQAEV